MATSDFQDSGDIVNSESIPEKGKRTHKETIVYVLKNITVEPTLTLLILSWIIASFTSQNLMLDKACRVNLNLTTKICDSLTSDGAQNENEKEVQLFVSKYLPYKTYVSATLSSVLTILAGSYSDKTGQRKLFISISLAGQIINSINSILHTYFFYQLNLQALIFSEAIIEGLCGGATLPTFIIINYIVAITTDKNRTFRLGLMNFTLTIGYPTGMATSGIMLQKYGYFGGYGLALSIHAINFIYSMMFINEPSKTVEQEKNYGKGLIYKLRIFFNLLNIWQTFVVVFRSGQNCRRLRMFIYMTVGAVIYGTVYGAESSILYMMVRYRFNWDVLQFTLYQTYSCIVQTLGTVFAISVFSKWWGWHDSLLGIITGFSKIAGYIIFCFAPTGTIFFLGPLAEIFATTILPMRSIISKMAESSELGKVMAVISLVENLAPLVFVKVFTSVYQATISTLPGAVYLVAAAIMVPILLVFSWLFYEHKKGKKDHEEKIDD